MLTGDVCVADLLGHDAQPVYGAHARRTIKDSTVLVTGAGGSIGSEIGRQLRYLGAGNIIYLDNNEYNLYLLERELRGTAALTDDTLVLADVQNLTALRDVFATHRPQMVFHAAAVKHLPLLERSPAMAILTNVLGTYNVATASLEYGAERFVNVSTDKAANPTSVLGMTKRLAEIVSKQIAGHGVRVASVRFGNVFNSRGSFVETFAWQISNGLPVTITDPDMTRYFMTIPQAAGLVIEAATMAGDGDTFILDMGESCNIVSLVNRYVEMSGADRPRILYTGRRQGEKLDEHLFDHSEQAQSTQHPAISRVSVSGHRSLDEIRALCGEAQHQTDSGLLRGRLEQLIADHRQPPSAVPARRRDADPARLDGVTRRRPIAGWRRVRAAPAGAPM